jgi:hypothetical protein
MVGYFTTQIKLHGQWGPLLETSICRAWIKMPSCLLGSRVSMWWVPEAVLEAATAFSSTCLATKPSHVGAEVDGSDCRLR